jgi:predicted Zn finger-like uncharacterized protein
MRVSCPHCRTPCVVAEQHLGVPVKCGRCARTFTTRADPGAPAVRLDLGAAAAPGCLSPRDEEPFLVQHLVYSNLDERHELALLAIADGAVMRTVTAALTPLLSSVLSGASKDVEAFTASCKNLSATATVIVVWDGQVHLGCLGNGRLSHQRAGQRIEVTRDPMKLAAGDWLFVTGDALSVSALQGEIAKASSSAADLSQRLVEGAGGTVIAVRCY